MPQRKKQNKTRVSISKECSLRVVDFYLKRASLPQTIQNGTRLRWKWFNSKWIAKNMNFLLKSPESSKFPCSQIILTVKNVLKNLWPNQYSIIHTINAAKRPWLGDGATPQRNFVSHFSCILSETMGDSPYSISHTRGVDWPSELSPRAPWPLIFVCWRPLPHICSHLIARRVINKL